MPKSKSSPINERPGGFEFDYQSADGRIVAEIKTSPRGLENLRANVLRLAMALNENPGIENGYLLFGDPRVRSRRISEEWQRALAALRPGVAERMALVDLANRTPDQTLPPAIRLLAEERAATGAARAADSPRSILLSLRRTELFKLLLVRWLLRIPRLTIGELAKQAASSYPAAKAVLTGLDRAGLLSRSGNRGVELTGFPYPVWSELVTGRYRSTYRFTDVTMPAAPADAIIKRLRRKAPPNAALGGVVAARHWDAHFDLNGIPRVDLELGTPDREPDLYFVSRLDPALRPALRPTDPVHLAVHSLRRAEPMFVPSSTEGLPFADPVETALDLIEMGLEPQANQLLARLRPEIRF